MREESSTPPIACTLSSGDLRQRLAAIAMLSRESLLSQHTGGLSIHLRYNPAAAPAVKEMVRKEQQCCAFLAFDLHESPSALELVITAPESARSFATLLFEQFTTPS